MNTHSQQFLAAHPRGGLIGTHHRTGEHRRADRCRRHQQRFTRAGQHVADRPLAEGEREELIHQRGQSLHTRRQSTDRMANPASWLALEPRQTLLKLTDPRQCCFQLVDQRQDEFILPRVAQGAEADGETRQWPFRLHQHGRTAPTFLLSGS